MSTRRWPARHALRTRVSISATGSITLIRVRPLLPAGLAHAGNLPAQRQLTEADAAQLELPQRTPAAAAAAAAVVAPHLELRALLDSFQPRLLRHVVSLSRFRPEGHAQFFEQGQRGVVAPGARYERDVHPVN